MMKFGIKYPGCVISIALLTVHELLEELEIANCIHYFTFDEYLILADAADVHCRLGHRLASESIRHRHDIRSPIFALSFSSWPNPPKLYFVLAGRMFQTGFSLIKVLQFSRVRHYTHFQLPWIRFIVTHFLLSFHILSIWVIILYHIICQMINFDRPSRYTPNYALVNSFLNCDHTLLSFKPRHLVICPRSAKHSNIDFWNCAVRLLSNVFTNLQWIFLPLWPLRSKNLTTNHWFSREKLFLNSFVVKYIQLVIAHKFLEDWSICKPSVIG